MEEVFLKEGRSADAKRRSNGLYVYGRGGISGVDSVGNLITLI